MLLMENDFSTAMILSRRQHTEMCLRQTPRLIGEQCKCGDADDFMQIIYEMLSKDENYFQKQFSHRAPMHGSLLTEMSSVLAFRGMLN